MWVSDLTSSATRLSCLPQWRLSTLQEHSSVRIDVYISTAPKESSPRRDKSCKKTGFGLGLSEGNFPFIMGECFACQHEGMFGAFGHSDFEGIKDGLLFLPAGDSPLQGDCKQADLLTVFLPCLSGNVSQEKLV